MMDLESYNSSAQAQSRAMMHLGSTDGDPFAKLLQFSILPVAKVLLMCFLGFLMATSYVGILTAENRRILSKVRMASALS